MKSKILSIISISFGIIILVIILIDRTVFKEDYYYYITLLFWLYSIGRNILIIVDKGDKNEN